MRFINRYSKKEVRIEYGTCLVHYGTDNLVATRIYTHKQSTLLLHITKCTIYFTRLFLYTYLKKTGNSTVKNVIFYFLKNR